MVTQYTKWTTSLGPPKTSFQVATESDGDPPPPQADIDLHVRLVAQAQATAGLEPVPGEPIIEWQVPPS